MLRLLLDEQIDPDVAIGVRQEQPSCTVFPLREWRAGSYLSKPDEVILAAAGADKLTLVSYDLSSIPAILEEWGREGKAHAGLIFVSSKTIHSRDVGSLARALITMWNARGHEDWTNIVDYLRRPR